MLARLLVERSLGLAHVAEGCPRVGSGAGHFAVAEVPGGGAAVRGGLVELGGGVKELRGGLEALVHAATLTRDEGAREVLRIERTQVVEAFADADQLHGQTQLVRDRDRDPALGGPVELRQGDAGDADRLAE